MERKILQEAAEKFGTPSYLFDLDRLTQRMETLKKALGSRTELCYAMKANPFLTGALRDLADRFEVCSPGEYDICRRLDIPEEKLVISGVNKSPEDTARMMDDCPRMGRYTAESPAHLELLHQCASQRKRKVPVLLRLTSGNQFGMDEEEVRRIVAERAKYPFLDIVGIQQYSGTQKHSEKRLRRQLSRLDGLISSLREESGFETRELEYGPGLPVFYFQDDEAFDEEAFLGEFASALADMAFQGHITLELGRSIAAECGYYLTAAADCKTNKGQHYVILDGGLHQMNYYGQSMAMRVPTVYRLRERDGEETLWNLCGSLCTVNDILVKQLPVKNLQPGDVFVFEKTGAYSVTEGMALFLSRDLPAVVSWSEKDGFRLLRERQSVSPLNTPCTR